ncbi:MAG: isoprenylcysteine carboxylmethyltransferase family protein [Phycisphaeraceae bacterium]
MRILPPFYFLLAVAIMVAMRVWWPGYQWLDWPWTGIGIVVGLTGFSITMFCVLSFTKAGTTVRPFEHSEVLVTDGLYRHSRNPMYVGLVTMLTGVAVGLGSVTSLIIPPLFAVWMTIGFIVKEEKMLAERFGEQYETFRKSVRRWI